MSRRGSNNNYKKDDNNRISISYNLESTFHFSPFLLKTYLLLYSSRYYFHFTNKRTKLEKIKWFVQGHATDQKAYMSFQPEQEG